MEPKEEYEVEEIEGDTSEELWVYGLLSEPSFSNQHGSWVIDMVYFQDQTDKNSMGSGVLNSATVEGLQKLQKYFRQNVDPLPIQEVVKMLNDEQQKKFLRAH